jgi:hypothetical protein
MTNKIALFLAVVLLAAIGLDLGLNDGRAALFLARRFLDLVEWVAFWR